MTKPFIKTGVIGHPISHSKSPLIHNSWIAQYKLSGEYAAIDIPCETLYAGIQNLIEQKYAGFNVTIPYKIAILQHCNEVDDNAKIVGAVNTVVIKNEKLFGMNTDVFGFIENIKSTNYNFSFTKGAALILGAGGAARAIIQGLIAEGVPEILIANRTKSNADELLNFASAPERIKIIPWEERSLEKHLHNINLLANTTSLGMTGKQALEINLRYLPTNALVNDLVYAPLHTDLLKQAKARGNPIVTGIGMLLHQARPAFEAWYGILPDISKDLQEKVLA